MSESDIAKELYVLNLQNWMAVSMNALSIFEYITTFDQEISSVWKRKRNGASLLLFSVRYVMLLTATVSILSFGRLNIKECTALGLMNDVLVILGSVLTAIFSALRVYALCSGSVSLSAAVFALQLSPVAVNLYGSINSAANIDPIFGCMTDYRFGSKTVQTLVLASRVPLIFGDAVVLAITWIKSIRQLRMQRILGMDLPLSTLLFRDGTVYFLLLFVLNVLELSPLSTAEAGFFISSVASTLPLILINRFMLNLRQLSESETHSADNHIARTTLVFRANVDITGNMGESLEHGWEAREDDGLYIEEIPVDTEQSRPPGHQLEPTVQEKEPSPSEWLRCE